MNLIFRQLVILQVNNNLNAKIKRVLALKEKAGFLSQRAKPWPMEVREEQEVKVNVRLYLSFPSILEVSYSCPLKSPIPNPVD